MKLSKNKAEELCDFNDISKVSIQDILDSLLNEEDIRKFTPDGECRIDPRSGLRILYSEKRAKRPHDNKPADSPSVSRPAIPCPVCEGNTTRIIDMHPLSQGFTFINKNLFPILYPEGTPDKQFNFLNPPLTAEPASAYGFHFLQWPSNRHEMDFENMPAEDSRIVLERLSIFENKMLHSDINGLTSTSAYETPPHSGFSGIIKNYGHLVGGSLSHGHIQIAFTNIMPRVIADDIHFRDSHSKTFIQFLASANPENLALEKRDHFTAAVPFCMKRPLQTIIYYNGDEDYFHHIPHPHLDDCAVLLKKNIASVISIMEAIGREPAYNIIFHSGPGCEFYLEILPYTQETGGYEHLGLFVCQGSARSTADMYRNTGDFR